MNDKFIEELFNRLGNKVNIDPKVSYTGSGRRRGAGEARGHRGVVNVYLRCVLSTNAGTGVLRESYALVRNTKAMCVCPRRIFRSADTLWRCPLHPHLGEFFGDGAFGERAQIGRDVDAGDDGDPGASG